MKNRQKLYFVWMLSTVLFATVSCSTDDEAEGLSVEAGITGTWVVASEEFLVNGKTDEELEIPREKTKVPPAGSVLDFKTNKSLAIAVDGTVISESAWRTGEDRNLFVALQDENIETEFAVQSLTNTEAMLYHLGAFDLDEDGELDKIEIKIELTRE